MGYIYFASTIFYARKYSNLFETAIHLIVLVFQQLQLPTWGKLLRALPTGLFGTSVSGTQTKSALSFFLTMAQPKACTFLANLLTMLHVNALLAN